ncbi:sorbose reductase [Alteromonas aestuariivivens]|uniref:Chaperone NapD n=1 Tax=Alteromonas aestuariivivens TaxID=1938339 RepID=A0A3D8M4P6_9ALTE|nr:chaperone NapD [Alteromonas aestuariivivens]RDV24504.1 sorbose reductase [Alteromonas aestuariivivens]
MSEYHVASLIVRCRPEQLYTATRELGVIPGAEVHATDISGKIIVTAEGTSQQTIAHISEQMRIVTGVVDVAAVYHEYAPDSSSPSPLP